MVDFLFRTAPVCQFKHELLESYPFNEVITFAPVDRSHCNCFTFESLICIVISIPIILRCLSEQLRCL